MKKTILIMSVAIMIAMSAVYAVRNYYDSNYATTTIVHTVKPGDTLYGIAQKYAEQQNRYDDLRGIVCDIESANNLNKKYLSVGEAVLVPLKTKINN